MIEEQADIYADVSVRVASPRFQGTIFRTAPYGITARD